MLIKSNTQFNMAYRYDGFGSKLTRLNKVFRGRRSAEELTKCQGCKVLVLKLKDVWQASKQASYICYSCLVFDGCKFDVSIEYELCGALRLKSKQGRTRNRKT